MLIEKAPAKVNLSLHVTGRRADGYHLLESLVVFASVHDTLTLEPGRPLGITVTGPRAVAAGPDDDNLVIRAARNLAARVEGLRLGHFSLEKHLPAAAGLGGGSSDAAAALRLLAILNDLPANDPRLAEAARATGADVPVCLDPRPAMMRGIGEIVEPLSDFPALGGILVNPGRSVETRAVFTALGLKPGESNTALDHPSFSGTITADDVILRLQQTSNHLEAPARRLEPAIAEVMAAIATTNASLIRMSGSGATVFALYRSSNDSVQAAALLRGARPAWWVEPVTLGAA